MLLRSEPSRNEMIFNGISQSEVVVAIRRHIPVFDHLIMEMSINCFLNAANGRLFGDFSDTNSPAVFCICSPGSHRRSIWPSTLDGGGEDFHKDVDMN